MSSKLKNCPFCGSEATVYKRGKLFGVACKATDANYHADEEACPGGEWCPAEMQIQWFDKEEDAIAIWNDRPYEQQLERLLNLYTLDVPNNYGRN